MVRAAKLYYDLERTQAEIGRELGLNRFQVARLLKEAREIGILRIEIVPRARRRPDLEVALQKRFDMRDAIVVAESGNEAVAIAAVAEAAALHLAGLSPSPRLIGVSWGRTMSAVARAALGRLGRRRRGGASQRRHPPAVHRRAHQHRRRTLRRAGPRNGDAPARPGDRRSRSDLRRAIGRSDHRDGAGTGHGGADRMLRPRQHGDVVGAARLGLYRCRDAGRASGARRRRRHPRPHRRRRGRHRRPGARRAHHRHPAGKRCATRSSRSASAPAKRAIRSRSRR